MQDKAGHILLGKIEMTEAISEKWGKLALEEVNKLRREKNIKDLEWSNELHKIAYNRNY